jgi:uncharacterized repeat protein (TIGR03803 family)
MFSCKMVPRLCGALAVAVIVLISVPSSWGAPRYKVLHAFGTGTDGGGLWSSVVFGKNGNLYGTTSGGGLYGAGTVYRLTPGSAGVWSETLIHDFLPSGTAGDGPNGGLVFDLEGNLYGTTAGGALTATAQFSN